MQSVLDNKAPSLADIRRQLENSEHELDELVKISTTQRKDDINQALYRVREAIGHVKVAEEKEA